MGIFIIFLLSALLCAVIGFGVGWVTGTGLPERRLRASAKKPLYIFDQADGPSLALADHIRREQPEALCVFAGGKAAGDHLCIPLTVREILNTVKKRSQPPYVIFTGRNAQARMAQCGDCGDAIVVCQSTHEPEKLSPGLRLFDRDTLCARHYWHSHPLKKTDRQIVLIGFGSLGRRILEHALENNIFTPLRTVTYHVYGDTRAFFLDHPQLGNCVSVGLAAEGSDSVIPHDTAWNADPAVLQNADRIILCSDDEEENGECYHRLRTYFPVTAPVHLYSSQPSKELPAFGADSEICTPDAVLHSGQEEMGRRIHELCRAGDGENAPVWEELSPFLRRSNFASAQHMAEKLRFLLEDDTLTEFTPAQLRTGYERFLALRQVRPDICRRIEHDRRSRFLMMYNWVYDPQQDNALRRHPMLVPFEELSEEAQIRNDDAWELIGKLADQAQQNT